MQSVVFPGPNEVQLQYMQPPACGPDDVLIEVLRAGLCGTDLHIHRGEYAAAWPLVPGHEFAGRVVEVGEQVPHIEPGQRVTADPNLSCGHCAHCRRLEPNQCLNWQGVGITRPGAFAERVVVPAAAVYPLPDDLTDAQGAFIEPLACAVHGINRFRVDVGDAALVFGAGPMGLLLVQLLRRRGVASVAAVEKQPDRLALAESFGATPVPADGTEHGTLCRLAPSGFHVIIEATGVPAVVEAAFAHLRPYGRYLQFGVTPRGQIVRLDPHAIFRHDWTILGSFALCQTFEQSLALLASGAVAVESLISHTRPLGEFERGLAAFASGQTLKVQFALE